MSNVRDTTIKVVKIVRLSKSTLPPEEDRQSPQYAVETKPLIHIIQDEQYVSWHTQQIALNQSRYCISIGNNMICSDIWHKYHEWYFKIVKRNFTNL